MSTATDTSAIALRPGPQREPAPGEGRAGTPGQGVAIVHDYLNQCGGAERVALELARTWPGAPIYTSLYRPSPRFRVRGARRAGQPARSDSGRHGLSCACAAVSVGIPRPWSARRAGRDQLDERLGARRAHRTGLITRRLLPQPGTLAVSLERASRQLARQVAPRSAAATAASLGPGRSAEGRPVHRKRRTGPRQDPARLRPRCRGRVPAGRR